MHKSFVASLALALAAPIGARADTASDVQALKQEIEAIRNSYEARLQALEQRLKAAETAAAAAPPAVVAQSVAPAPAAPFAAAGGSNSFNPAMC